MPKYFWDIHTQQGHVVYMGDRDMKFGSFPNPLTKKGISLFENSISIRWNDSKIMNENENGMQHNEYLLISSIVKIEEINFMHNEGILANVCWFVCFLNFYFYGWTCMRI